jgi:hypothetical protein
MLPAFSNHFTMQMHDDAHPAASNQQEPDMSAEHSVPKCRINRSQITELAY